MNQNKLFPDKKNEYSKTSIWSIHFAFWILIISFIVYFSALSFNGMYFFRRSLVFIAGNILLFYACYSWIFPDFILKKKIVKGLFILFFIVFTVVLIRYYGDSYLMRKFGRLPEVIMPVRRRIILMFLSEFTFAGFAGLIKMIVNNYENNKRVDELEKLQLNTELQFLKLQTSPHFLFNSINNIYSLVLMKSDKAPEALMKLSDLLRYSLYDCHNKVRLSQEIEAVSSYIELFRLKYEHNLNINLNIATDYTDFLIEPLLYVPLIENAFKYSGIGISPDAFINIRLFQEDNFTCFDISNSKGIPDKEQSASGIGLVNIQKRLDILYPEKYLFEIQETENTFEITLKLQLI